MFGLVLNERLILFDVERFARGKFLCFVLLQSIVSWNEGFWEYKMFVAQNFTKVTVRFNGCNIII